MFVVTPANIALTDQTAEATHIHKPGVPDTKALLIADSMGKSFAPKDNVMQVEAMAGGTFWYYEGLIAGQILDISRTMQIFTLLGANMVKSWISKDIFTEAAEQFVKAILDANPYAQIFLGSVPPRLKAKPDIEKQIKDFNWALNKIAKKYTKAGMHVKMVPLQKIFLNEDHSFKDPKRFFQEDQFHISTYAAYWIRLEFLQESKLVVKKGSVTQLQNPESKLPRL